MVNRLRKEDEEAGGEIDDFGWDYSSYLGKFISDLEPNERQWCVILVFFFSAM